MALDQEKYLNALLYFISECGNEKLGKTKLNKLFYYLDFISYRDRNKSVTGETYIHLPMGPFAISLEKKIIGTAKEKKIIRVKKEQSKKFRNRDRYEPVGVPNMEVFDEYEKKLLGYLCKEFKEWSTDQMIAQTHSEAPWVFSDVQKELDYKNADDIEFFREDSIRVI